MITILTPTYNRAYRLPKLYQSLLEQTDYNFEWLVIDDGSTDKTEDLIQRYQQSSPFDIRYIKKSNGGKHTALNIGFEKSKFEWVFIVDSDDHITTECIQKIAKEIIKIPEEYNSIRMLRIDEKSRILGSKYPKKMNNYIQIMNSTMINDNADIFRKSALNGFSFPEFKDEKFMAESPIYYWLGIRGLTKFMNYGGYVAEYLPNGLSDRSIENRHMSFNSSLYVYENIYKLTSVLDKKKHRAGVNWWRFRALKGSVQREFVAPIFYAPFGFCLLIKDSLSNKKIRKNFKV